MCTLKVVDDYVCMQAQFNTYAFVLLDTCTENRWKTGTKVVLTIHIAVKSCQLWPNKKKKCNFGAASIRTCNEKHSSLAP